MSYRTVETVRAGLTKDRRKSQAWHASSCHRSEEQGHPLQTEGLSLVAYCVPGADVARGLKGETAKGDVPSQPAGVHIVYLLAHGTQERQSWSPITKANIASIGYFQERLPPRSHRVQLIFDTEEC
jgi:hypothetical protein